MPPVPRDTDQIWFAHVLRGPACLLIAFTHYGMLFTRDTNLAASIAHFSPGPQIRVLWDPIIDLGERFHFLLGASALTWLFLISGFVIPLSLEQRGLRYFATRRVFRIYPTLAWCIAMTVIVLWFQTYHGGKPIDISASDGFFNVTALAPYAGVKWIEPAAWTIAVEELFYAATALLAWRGWLARPLALLGVGVTTTLIAVIPVASDGNQLAYWIVFNFAFVPFVFIGTSLYHYWRGAWSLRETVVLSAALYALWMISMYFGPNGFQATLYTRSAVLGVIVFVLAMRFDARLPRGRVLDELSLMSYPIYMLHSTIGFVIINLVQRNTGSYYYGIVAAFAFVIALAFVTHRLIEAPSMRLGRSVARRGNARGSDDVEVNARA